MKFDINKIRSVLRGEVNGSVRFLLMSFAAAFVWVASWYLSGMYASAHSSFALQRERYNTLSVLAAEYKAAAPSASAAGSVRRTDAMAVFTQVSNEVSLGIRVTRIVPSPDRRRCSVEIGRIYAEELTDLIRGLSERGMRVVSARLRALPAGQERLFSLEADIEAVS
ncbi:hypothetical protein FACS1894187_20000 [Synergistales bacterium]|nr:hypothetical protein FACS1894187_20000 [Synergistales bacterium]